MPGNVTIKRAWPHVNPSFYGRFFQFPGFFRESWRIDKKGQEENNSLNLPQGKEIWQSYEAPLPAQHVIDTKGAESKYEQPETQELWTGVVLAAQISSLKRKNNLDTGRRYHYREFVQEACKFFGKRLLIKLHPHDFGSGSEKWHKEIAREHEIPCGFFGSSIISHCEFVVLFHSLYAIDALLADVNVLQYAPGVIYDTGAVTYCDGALTATIDNRLGVAQKLLDFAVWRYHFALDLSAERIKEITDIYCDNDDLYPLPESHSYAATMLARRTVDPY